MCRRGSHGPVACGSATGRAAPGSGPAARSCPGSARAPTGADDPGRVLPVALAPRNSFGCAARWRRTSVNEASSSRQRAHTGFQYTPVASHRHVRRQPASRSSQAASSSRPAVVLANSRCSVVTFRPAAMRAHAFTHREWTVPARRTGDTKLRHASPPVSRSAERGVSAGTKSRRRVFSRANPVSQYVHGCSRDSGSNYETGSRHHRENQDLCASVIRPTQYTCFIDAWVRRRRHQGNYMGGNPLCGGHLERRATGSCIKAEASSRTRGPRAAGTTRVSVVTNLRQTHAVLSTRRSTAPVATSREPDQGTQGPALARLARAAADSGRTSCAARTMTVIVPRARPSSAPSHHTISHHRVGRRRT